MNLNAGCCFERPLDFEIYNDPFDLIQLVEGSDPTQDIPTCLLELDEFGNPLNDCLCHICDLYDDGLCPP